MTQKGKNLLIWKSHETMTKKHAYRSNELQLRNHSVTFIHLNKSLPSVISILSRSPVAYNTTVSLEKLTCTDYLDFGNYQDRFRQFSWSKKDSKYLDVEFKVFKKDENQEFRLVEKPTMGDADFNQFMRLRKQLVSVAENFAREENLTPVLIPTLSKEG